VTSIPDGPVPPGSVVAVVVTRHRSAQLVESLAAMAKQSHPIAHLVVVDNGPDEPAREVVEECAIPATWLPSWRNLRMRSILRWPSARSTVPTKALPSSAAVTVQYSRGSTAAPPSPKVGSGRPSTKRSSRLPADESVR